MPYLRSTATATCMHQGAVTVQQHQMKRVAKIGLIFICPSTTDSDEDGGRAALTWSTCVLLIALAVSRV